MSHEIPFHQDTYKPKTIEGNDQLPPGQGVEFDLSAVGSPSLVLLKGLVFGSAVLAFNPSPSGEELTSAADGIRRVGPAFVEGVDKVRGLSIPDKLARRLFLRDEKDASTGPFPITTGTQFARVAHYESSLALEIGYQLINLSTDKGVGVDPRLFGLPSGFRTTATPGDQSGIASAAAPANEPGATVGSVTPRPARRSTSRTSRHTR